MDWRNTEVEVYLPNGACYLVNSKADEDQIEGWWQAKIQVLKGDNCYIKYIDRDGMDLVTKDNIRPVNQGFVLERINHLNNFQRIGLKSNESTSEDLKQKAELLTDLHVKALKDKLHQRQYREKKKHTETFMVTSDLMKFSIGTKGANIKKAAGIKGIGSVTKVECDDECLFKISGESPEAVKQARELLEFKKEQLTVPHHFAGRIIGKAGQEIDEIINKSMVIKIMRQNRPDGVVFNIIGTPESVENAKILLNFKLDALKQDVNITTTERNDTYVEIGDSLSQESVSGESSSFSINSEKHHQKFLDNQKEVDMVTEQEEEAGEGEKVDAQRSKRNDEYLNESLSKELPSDSEQSSDENQSSSSINNEPQNPNHRQPYRGRLNGNRTERGGRGGRGRFIRGRISQQVENTQNQTDKISAVIQHDVRTNVRNNDFETQELIADSDKSLDDTQSFASINSEQHNPVHIELPDRVNIEKEGGLGKQDDFIADTSQSKQTEIDDNVGNIALERSSDGVRHKDTRYKPQARDTETLIKSEESFPPKIKEGTNTRHQAQVVKIQGCEEADDESMQMDYDSLSQSSVNSGNRIRRKGVHFSVRGSNRKGSRIRGGLRQRHHLQRRSQRTDDPENIHTDAYMMDPVDDNSPLSNGFDDKFSTGEDVTKSLAKFNALLEDKPKPKMQVESKAMKEKRLKEEALDKINEMEVLKCLVQRFEGGCFFGSFSCIANELFPGYDGMKEWFNTRSQKFHIYRDGQDIVYICSFYKDLNICKHFCNPSKPTFCDNQNCNYFHVCRNFVRGNCRRHHCCFLHDFDSAQNVRIKEKYGLEDFTDSEIIVLLNWKFPRLCPHYIYEQGGCKETDNKDEACPYLHYCKNYFFGKCDMGDGCRYNHSFSDSHNKWVLRSCHLANQNEDALKRMIYVPPNLENHKEQVDAEDFHGIIFQAKKLQLTNLRQMGKEGLNIFQRSSLV
ncbi:FMR [Mytilus edulis]|uniref:FMR n=1 Tax=Mytilus edulis TaxID=6550 RepID=A0A8S3SAM0_MYTED|nr:FMR [Mytilus edulis]